MLASKPTNAHSVARPPTGQSNEISVSAISLALCASSSSRERGSTGFPCLPASQANLHGSFLIYFAFTFHGRQRQQQQQQRRRRRWLWRRHPWPFARLRLKSLATKLPCKAIDRRAEDNLQWSPVAGAIFSMHVCLPIKMHALDSEPQGGGELSCTNKHTCTEQQQAQRQTAIECCSEESGPARLAGSSTCTDWLLALPDVLACHHCLLPMDKSREKPSASKSCTLHHFGYVETFQLIGSQHDLS